jgi:hypothetical protein
MNDFINENWSLVQQEIGKPIYVALARVANDIISNVARKFVVCFAQKNIMGLTIVSIC